eukprot:6321020-Amphidinium_carterae.4
MCDPDSRKSCSCRIPPCTQSNSSFENVSVYIPKSRVQDLSFGASRWLLTGEFPPQAQDASTHFGYSCTCLMKRFIARCCVFYCCVGIVVHVIEDMMESGVLSSDYWVTLGGDKWQGVDPEIWMRWYRQQRARVRKPSGRVWQSSHAHVFQTLRTSCSSTSEKDALGSGCDLTRGCSLDRMDITNTHT